MALSSATMSTKTLIVILSLAAMPAVSFAQATGGASSTGSTGATGSTGLTGSTGSTGPAGGVANSPASPPGTNSLGTAQSSGRGSVTTGAGTGDPTADATVNSENRLLDKKMNSICRGC